MHQNAQNALLSGILLNQPNTLVRLLDEFAEAVREVREDPVAYLSAIKSHGPGSSQRATLLRFGLSLAILCYALAFAFALLFWTINRPLNATASEEQFVKWITAPPYFLPPADIGSDENEAGGGGGGGRHTQTPPSHGNFAQFQLSPPVVAPAAEPQLKVPILPLPEAVFADPRLQPERDDLARTGLPNAVPSPPSDGPGGDRGIGTGNGGGQGPGNGPGAGDGEGGNLNGGSFRLGGPRNSRTSQLAVDSKPVLINNPRPLYTEEARRQKIQGSVKARIRIGADGLVKDVVVLSGLPDGLTEQAILAAYQMRFTPAMRAGRPVPYWIGNVVIEFNLR